MKALKFVLVLVVVGLAFGGGYLLRGRQAPGAPVAGADGRKVLYWVDPMHPAYKSDKPGIAPDCGMTLEPVYADERRRRRAGRHADRKRAATTAIRKHPTYTARQAGPQSRDRQRRSNRSTRTTPPRCRRAPSASRPSGSS